MIFLNKGAGHFLTKRFSFTNNLFFGNHGCGVFYLVSFCAFLFVSHAKADIFYYNNMITGDRAVGLGGAFTAVADDASAVIYNPAGLGYLLNNSISGSANAYQIKSLEYLKTVGKKSFTENSESFFAPFVGGAKKLDNVLPNLSFAFAIYSPDSEFKDQDDYIREAQLGIESFHRTQNRRASTLSGGVALGYRVVPFLSVGGGVGFVNIDELQQSYQDVVLRVDAFSKDLTEAAKKKGSVFNTQTINTRSKLVARAVEPIVGMQAVIFENISLGVMYKHGVFINQQLALNGDSVSYYHFENGQVVSKDDMSKNFCETNKNSLICSAAVRHYTAGKEYSKLNAISLKNDKPFLQNPSTIRFGAAWFASPRFLLSADLERRYAVAAARGLGLSRNNVTNFHIGSEFYVTQNFPWRAGLFTNNDTRPRIVKNGRTDQRDHIDFIGFATSLSWAQASGQVTGGVSVQRGSGEAQKVSGSAVVQKVVGSSYALFFSATHYL